MIFDTFNLREVTLFAMNNTQYERNINLSIDSSLTLSRALKLRENLEQSLFCVFVSSTGSDSWSIAVIRGCLPTVESNASRGAKKKPEDS